MSNEQHSDQVAVTEGASSTRHRNGGSERWLVVELTIRIARMLRRDVTAMALLAVNIWTVIHVITAGHPFAAVLIVYWMQFVAIGLWLLPKIFLVAGKRSLLPVVLVLLGYFPLVYLFGVIAGGMLDNQMQGTQWLAQFSFRDFAPDGLGFLASHGLSFFLLSVRRHGIEETEATDLVILPVIRVMPMAAVALVGGFVTAFFNSATALAWIVVPVKIWLDLTGHLLEHHED